MPSYDRIALRPRLFYESDSTRALVTIGAMAEERQGGTTPNGTVPTGSPFPQDQKTQRIDAGIKLSHSLNDLTTVESSVVNETRS